MSVPTGIEAEIYASSVKTSDIRVKIQLDRVRAETNFVDEFAGATLNPALWNKIQPSNTIVEVTGGKLKLRSTLATNAFPVVWSMPGKTFPQDPSISWTLEFTIDFPTITGFGVFFQVIDLVNANPIMGIEVNSLDYSIQMPWQTEIESLGAGHTTSHDYELIYTPPVGAGAGSYELKRDTVSKGTLSASSRPAWAIVIGNGTVQTTEADWTEVNVSRVDVNLVTVEDQDYPEWTDREQITIYDGAGENAHPFGRLPTVIDYQEHSHERNQIDQAMVTLAAAGFIFGMSDVGYGSGYRPDLYAGFEWENRLCIVESRQGDGQRWTTWKEVLRGLCAQPEVSNEAGGKTVRLTLRDYHRAIMQASHLIQGYSDAGEDMPGVKMHYSAPDIMTDIASLAGSGAVSMEVHADIVAQEAAVVPRNWQLLSANALGSFLEIADDLVARVYRSTAQGDKGKIMVDDYRFGTDTPTFFPSLEADIVNLDWVESTYGMTAQILENVQHSEFSEFTEVYPPAPIPPIGARLSHNSRVAQEANDINGIGSPTRRLAHLRWRFENRELNSVAISMVGQDWLAHGIETKVLDRKVLRIQQENYITIGWNYSWNARQGWRTTVHLANQHPEKAVMRSQTSLPLTTVIAAPRLLTPTTLSLTIATFAPAVYAQPITPTTRALVLTTFAPVIKHKIIVPKLSLTLATFAPTVTSSG